MMQRVHVGRGDVMQLFVLQQQQLSRKLRPLSSAACGLCMRGSLLHDHFLLFVELRLGWTEMIDKINTREAGHDGKQGLV